MNIDTADLLAIALNTTYPVAQMYRAACCRHEPGNTFPHLARSELRIQKTLHETGLGTLLRRALQALERLAQRMGECLGDRQSLDALGAPLG